MYDEIKLQTIFGCRETTSLLDQSFIEKLKYLRVLKWSHSSITQLPNSIDKIKHLRYFDLSYFDKLVSFPQTIGNLIALQTLKLNQRSNLVSLPESIGNLITLQTLELNQCSKLVSLPESIGNLITLQTLELNHCNKLVSLPQSIGNLITLQTLSLTFCDKLVGLPESIGNLITLQTLSLHFFGKLVGLPESIGNLITLQTLSLHLFGKLVGLPESIGNLITLQTLSLHYCDKLVGLSESIGNLITLQTLTLNFCCKLVGLPESIGNLITLQILELSYCGELACLPESIGNLIRLHTLKSRHCNKLDFPIEVIPKLINLIYLEIDERKAFNKMVPMGLGKLTSLQYLPYFVVEDNVERGCGKLNELKELNNIRGDLNIIHLDLVEDVTVETQETNLKAKENIQRLTLSWGGRKTNKNNDSSKLLDTVCPHQNLSELTVRYYPGERFSSWLYTLTRIVKISLYKLPCCQHLPPLERLPCLKNLKIKSMRKLQCIQCEEISDVFFPSLETLTLIGCENLRGWERLGDAYKPNDINHHLSLPPFPCLYSLEISGCPKLSCMPAFPHLVEKLKLCGCSMKPLNETCLLQLEHSSLLPPSALRHLEIRGVREVEVEAMAENWMKNLTSLKSLIIDALPEDWEQNLTYFESLTPIGSSVINTCHDNCNIFLPNLSY